MAIQHRLNKKVKDDKFTPEEIGRYNLSLQLNTTIFRICVTDSASNRCLLVEDYSFDAILYPEQLIEQLTLIYDTHEVLKAGYWKSIRVAIKEMDFSLIPKSLFDKHYVKDYLKINTGRDLNDDQDVMYYSQKSTDTISIFATDKKIMDWFSAQYPGKLITFVHHTTPFIEGILYDKKAEADKAVYMHVENNFFTIVVKNNSKGLEFCNSFYFSTPEDFVYFTMFVYHQLSLNPEKVPVTIFGEITHESELFRKLYKYIRNINFGDKPSSLSFSYQFDEIFDHKFFDLYSMHFCE
jgi:hypothetical protein